MHLDLSDGLFLGAGGWQMGKVTHGEVHGTALYKPVRVRDGLRRLSTREKNEPVSVAEGGQTHLKRETSALQTVAVTGGGRGGLCENFFFLIIQFTK